MAWVRLDDKRSTNRKLMRAGFAARGLDEAMMCWSAHGETDGHITEADVAMIAMGHGCKRWQPLVALLLREGRWEPEPGGWLIHDYLEFNPSKADREAERERKRAAGQIGGLRSGEARSKQTPKQPASEPAKQNSSDAGSETANPRPVPSRPAAASPSETHDPPDPSPAAAALIDQALNLLVDRRLATAGHVTNPGGYRKAALDGLRHDHADRLPTDLSPDWTPEQLADWLEPPATPTTQARPYDRTPIDCPDCDNTGWTTLNTGDATKCPTCNPKEAIQ